MTQLVNILRFCSLFYKISSFLIFDSFRPYMIHCNFILLLPVCQLNGGFTCFKFLSGPHSPWYIILAYHFYRTLMIPLAYNIFLHTSSNIEHMYIRYIVLRDLDKKIDETLNLTLLFRWLYSLI